MHTIKYILILLALAGVIVGCGTDNTPESGADEEITLTSSTQETGNTPESEADEMIILRSSEPETEPSNWYIRLVVEDTSRGMISNSSKLGELNMDNAVENQTLEAWSPVNDAHLGVFFVDPDDVVPGEYRSSFHKYEEAVESSWDFIVRTDDAYADLTFTWRGLYVLTPYVDDQGRTRYKEYRSLSNPLNKHMKLIDLYNDEEVPAIVDGKAVTYTFSMDGQTERAFRWVVQNETVVLSDGSDQLAVMNSKSMRKAEVVTNEQSIMKRAETFDLSKPPS